MALGPKNREAVTLELAEEVLRSSGRLQFVARGSSMIPAILPGDVLLARHQSIHSIRRGEIALWSRDGRFCAHRVLRLEEADERREIVTRGDALRRDDQPIQADEFLGCVYAIVRRGKRIDLNRRQTLWSRSTAFLVRRFEFAAKCFLLYHSFARRLQGTARAFVPEDRSELVECR